MEEPAAGHMMRQRRQRERERQRGERERNGGGERRSRGDGPTVLFSVRLSDGRRDYPTSITVFRQTLFYPTYFTVCPAVQDIIRQVSAVVVFGSA
ncbi:hypothetical protein Hanom_Chr16g01456691 [Helianthus anomalus]